MKSLINVLVISVGICFVACGSNPIEGNEKDIGVSVGCATLATLNCFEDAYVQAAIPGLTVVNCTNKVLEIINTGKVIIDPAKIAEAKGSRSQCVNAFKAIKNIQIK